MARDTPPQGPPPGVPVHFPPPRLSRANPEPARIVVPFTRVHPDTRSALEPYGRRVEYIEMTTPDAYWGLFRDLWSTGEDFVLVEHDIVPRPGTIDHFDRCPESWCSCSYTWSWKPQYSWLTDHSTKVLNSSLGATRFRAELLADCPELGTDDVLRRFKPKLAPPIPYYNVDSIVMAVLTGRKYAWCQHERVGHRQ